MQYTNQEKVEAYIERSLTENELVIFDGVVDYISNFITNYTGRIWSDIPDDYSEDPEESTRLYDGSGAKELFIDDFTELSKVELLDYEGNVYLELTEDSDFITYPLNKEFKQSIYLRRYKFPEGAARVKVTAIFGGGGVPEAIVMVATALVATFLNRMGEAGDFKRESIEGYSYEILTNSESSADTKDLLVTLDGWKKITL